MSSKNLTKNGQNQNIPKPNATQYQPGEIVSTDGTNDLSQRIKSINNVIQLMRHTTQSALLHELNEVKEED